MSQDNYLFLQPHPSLFGRELFKELTAADVKCHIINVSLSDWIFRLGLGAVNYKGKLEDWAQFLRQFIDENKITKIIYYSDQRPYHRIARMIAREIGIETYAYEYGYLRPDWITLEKSGMGVFSHFPNDPKTILDLASKIDYEMPTVSYGHTFFQEAFNEVLYNLTPALLPFVFRNHERDRYYHPIIDYISYIPRIFLTQIHAKKSAQVINGLIRQQDQYFVIPLQMQADYQVRRCSHYKHMREMVEEVISSFSQNAPVSDKLVFKLHPLDNNIEGWHTIIAKLGKKYNCTGRLEVIDSGNLEQLLQHSKGTILINSTVGLTALKLGIPVKVMGIAVFDVPGMTFQEDLDTFWINYKPPDEKLVEAFVKVLAYTIQIKGNFFSKEGRKVAAKEFTRRLINDEVNHIGAYVSPPPRLEKAKQMSVPMIYEID